MSHSNTTIRYKSYIKLFLRLALALGFLSASADRLGFWPEALSAWGNWSSFLAYTQVLNPWFPESFIPVIGWLATFAEIVLGFFLLIGFKTELSGKLSGLLLLSFALSMGITLGFKKVFDFSVLSASAASFAIAAIEEKRWEIDLWLNKKKRK